MHLQRLHSLNSNSACALSRWCPTNCITRLDVLVDQKRPPTKVQRAPSCSLNNVKGTNLPLVVKRQIVVVLRSRRILSRRLIYARFATFSTIRNASSSSPAGCRFFCPPLFCREFSGPSDYSASSTLPLPTLVCLLFSNRCNYRTVSTPSYPSPVSRSAFERISIIASPLLVSCQYIPSTTSWAQQLS